MVHLDIYFDEFDDYDIKNTNHTGQKSYTHKHDTFLPKITFSTLSR